MPFRIAFQGVLLIAFSAAGISKGSLATDVESPPVWGVNPCPFTAAMGFSGLFFAKSPCIIRVTRKGELAYV